jgi:terminase small subunit-like protein
MTPPRRRLLPRQLLFAEFCLTEPSAARAAIRAGYSPRSARNQAYRLLANDDIRRRIVGGVAAMRARDGALRERLLDRLERLFGAAFEAGRLEPALAALKAECAVSGLMLRARASPAQRAEALDLNAEAPPGAAPEPIGPLGEGKL